MTDSRSLMRDAIIPLVTTALGAGGTYVFQQGQHDTDLKAQQVMLATQHQAELEKARSERSDALYKAWGQDDGSRRRTAQELVSGAGERNFEALMKDPAVSAEQKFALGWTVRFFADLKGNADARRLNLAEARSLFQDDADWWSRVGMPALLRGYDESSLPRELASAAYGVAAIGGQVDGLSLPPLSAQQVRHYANLRDGPASGSSQRVALSSPSQPRPDVGEQSPSNQPASEGAPSPERVVDAQAIEACLRQTFEGDSKKKPSTSYKDWLNNLDAEVRRDLRKDCSRPVEAA